jgi:hypothetical protein
MTADTNSAQVHLAPLTRMEALYLLAGVRVGLVVCAEQGMTVERPGFHAVTGGEVLVRTAFGAQTAARLDDGLPVTYRAEALDGNTFKGWYATVTGTAEPVTDPDERHHYLSALPGFAAAHGNQLLRIRPHLITGHRFQNLTAPST